MREVKISVVGVGGGGSNAVTRLYNSGVKSARVIAINTDARHLAEVAKAHKKILIGKSITRGLGAGGEPSMARKCAEADYDLIRDALEGSELVFIAAGMGGGTGTGAAPIVAKAARDVGALTIGVVTYPFKLERARLQKAKQGIEELSKHTDTLIVIDNNRLVEVANNLPMDKAFEFADSIIVRAVKGISDAIVLPSLISMDFADLRAILTKANSGTGLAMISIGEGSGYDRVKDAIQTTFNQPLLDVDYEDARGALIHLEGGPDLTIDEAVKIGEGITESFNPDAEVKLGVRIRPELNDKIIVTAVIIGVHSPHILGKGFGRKGFDEEALDLGTI